jgi:hypothetical protein
MTAPFNAQLHLNNPHRDANAQPHEHGGEPRTTASQESPITNTTKGERKGFRMTHAIPTLRTASNPTYIPPALRRKSDTSTSTGNSAPGADFGTELKNQADPVVADPVVADPAPASRMIGTATPWSPATVVTPPAAATPAPMAPTAQSLFGDNPWSASAGGTGPNGSYNYNQYYFATPETAAKVAQMLGGKVVAADALTPSGPFAQNQPNQMVQMPDGRLINAGLVAGFYDHGYTQQTVDKMIAAEVSGNTMYS